MKIVQFMASEEWGGAEKVFVDLSNQLAYDHEVVVLLLRGTTYRDRFCAEVRIIELRAHPTTHNPLLVLEIIRILRDLQPDIIHTHAVKASLLVQRANLFLRRPHLATKHNARKGRIFNRLRWVSAVSQESKDSVSDHPGGETRVIRNGILPRPRPQKEQHDDFTLVAVGRLDAVKGFDILIRQFAEIPFPARLAIVGEGPEREMLERLIAEYSLGERVELPGFSNRVAEWMSNADLVVISSHSEGFPQVFVEALFYADVLISTPVGGVKENLPEMFLAKQERLAEKIIDVYRSYENYRQRFAELQASSGQAFHLQEIARQYVRFYETILQAE